MPKYLQFSPANIDANGLAPISAEVVSTGIPAPATGNQIAVEDDAVTSGKLIDTVSKLLVTNPAALDSQVAAGAVLTADVDMGAEYQKVVADESYFLANFLKIG